MSCHDTFLSYLPNALENPSDLGEELAVINWPPNQEYLERYNSWNQALLEQAQQGDESAMSILAILETIESRRSIGIDSLGEALDEITRVHLSSIDELPELQNAQARRQILEAKIIKYFGPTYEERAKMVAEADINTIF